MVVGAASAAEVPVITIHFFYVQVQKLRGRVDQQQSPMLTEHIFLLQVQNLQGMAEQQRFLRLQHLLKKSNVYSKFLLQRMDDQCRENARMEQNRRLSRKRRRSAVENKVC